MDKVQKNKIQNQIRKTNVLESLKDLGGDFGVSIKNDLLGGISQDILQQILNRNKPDKKASGNIKAGESLKMADLFSSEHQENIKLKKQIALERKLSQEDKARVIQRSNELKMQLHILMQEVFSLAKSTQGLGEKVEIAAMQAPSQPGLYHLIFFEKLLSFIQSFRAKIDSAATWLGAINKRAQKKNYWSMYKKHGTSFLLSGESYSQRSAG